MNSLAKLKQIINSMEFGVEAEGVNAVQTQLMELDTRFKNNRHAISFVKMMQAIAKYQASRSDGPNKEVVTVLGFLAKQLDALVSSPEISPKAADEILAQGIQSFNALKSKISAVPLVTEKEIESLKAVILSIDWEISDTTMENFDAVVNQLMLKVKPQGIHASFLKMISSIGGYLARNKALAHGDSIGLLRSVFQDFERLVQIPDMAVDEKKQMLELDVRAFHKFKRELGRLGPSVPDQSSTEEEVMPALSHLKPSPSTEQPVPLNKLPEQNPHGFDLSDTDEEITPALAGKKKVQPDSTAMMDDLFTAKASASDELLDAIHLADIDGADPDQGMAMFDAQDSQEQQEGVKRFTPQRIDREPIPEIESRLDEFFNLELPSVTLNPPVETIDSGMADESNGKPKPAVETIDPGPADEKDLEAIVPFQYEDETFVEDEDELAQELELEQELELALGRDQERDQEQEQEQEHDQEHDQEMELGHGREQQPDQELLQDQGKDQTQDLESVPGMVHRLRGCLENPGNLTNPADLTAFINELSLLKKAWQDDLDKQALLDMLAAFARYIHDPGQKIHSEFGQASEPPIDDGSDQVVADSSDLPDPGVWKRIKSFFTRA